MPILSREELINHLNIAAELEHSLMVQYLFAAFSIKKSTVELLTPRQEMLVKPWERKILQVASEEMAHLGTVYNPLSVVEVAPASAGRISRFVTKPYDIAACENSLCL